MVVAFAATMTLTGCSAGAGDEAGSADSGVESPQDAPAGETDGALEDLGSENDGATAAQEPSADGESAGLDETAAEAPTSDRNLAEAGLTFVTTAVVGVLVDDPYPALDRIADYAVDAGGGEVDRQFQAATEHEGARGSITVKLPPTTMNAAIEHLSTYGEVQSVNLHREDITVGVTDLAARIRVAQMSADRTEQWLATATSRDEAFELEQMFNQRLVELENLLSQQRADTHDTVLSTLTVQVYSPEAAPPPPPAPEPEPETGFIAGLTRGWDAFYAWGSDALQVVGVLLPWLVFFGLLTVAGYYIAKPIRTRQGSRSPRPDGPAGPTTALPPMVDRTGPGQPAPRNHAAQGPQRPTLAQLLPPAAAPTPPASTPPASTTTSEPPPPA